MPKLKDRLRLLERNLSYRVNSVPVQKALLIDDRELKISLLMNLAEDPRTANHLKISNADQYNHLPCSCCVLTEQKKRDKKDDKITKLYAPRRRRNNKVKSRPSS